MPSWSRKFHKPIHLRSGKTIDTLAQARALVLSLKDRNDRNEWQWAASKLLECADKKSSCYVAREAMKNALFLNAMLDVTHD